MSTSHSILHYTTIEINTKVYANNIQDNHQDLYQDHIKIYSNIDITIALITYSMNSNISTNIWAHILRSKMNSIHERHVSSQEKPKSMSHTFLKIIKWRNSRQTKRNSRSCHHKGLATSFLTSQEFCNFDSVWESYANFSEDAQKFLLHKVSHFSRAFLQELRNNKGIINGWKN